MSTDGATGRDGAAGPLAAAGVLFRDAAGRVMVVRAVYESRHPVEVPGGGWEPGDATLRATAVRELQEEMGLRPRLLALASVDWAMSSSRPPIVSFLYWAQPLTAAELAAVRLQEDELGGYAFVTPRQAASALPPRLSRRVAACLRSPAGSGPVEMEDSFPVGPAAAGLPPGPAPAYTRADGLDLAGGDRPPVVPPLDRETYYATRPRIRAEVQVLAADPGGRVRTARAPVAADRETPRAAAARLLRERLGSVRPPGRLLALDWLPGDRPRLVYVFDGGRPDRHRPAGEPAAAAEAAPAEDRRTAAALAHRGAVSGPLELVDGVPAADPG
ncbi:NUDIX domain-containing protein [Streptomyces sp. NRRL B-24484]|uniref:NUDIX domain-containing protein n=1 Tax=Streptomyces sp. NRRL B-24484 TaxID=1463833 RepID=UPI000694EF05|nr:NUDIX hydrolase [Streptomyces sp. NRRL B-24484]